nr:MAG TPA: hypothetical protein [Caudoviricetes sp.]
MVLMKVYDTDIALILFIFFIQLDCSSCVYLLHSPSFKKELCTIT